MDYKIIVNVELLIFCTEVHKPNDKQSSQKQLRFALRGVSMHSIFASKARQYWM